MTLPIHFGRTTIMIRRLQKVDVDRVMDLWLDTNLKAHDFIPAVYWRSNFGPVKEMLPRAEVYVYEDAGGIQGFVGLSGEYIEGIFVADETQSQGIGKRLLDHMKAIKDTLRLNVYQKNTRAIRFYQREGFVIQHESSDESTGEKEYTMLWRQAAMRRC